MDDEDVFQLESRGSLTLGHWHPLWVAWATCAAAGWLCYFKIQRLPTGADLGPLVLIGFGAVVVVSWGGIFALLSRAGSRIVRGLTRVAGMFLLSICAGALVGGFAGLAARSMH